ncbi:MAG: hypothetical protein DMF81_15475 [Acidobacteria bacterium]|nr:MAG: hypothetical protein DMF81_15475 [Acidobacteriota bacterium]
MNRLETVARVLLGAACAYLLVLLAYTTLSRIRFPYELEWLEGWTVESVRRVLAGKSLFVAPSVEWIPYPYTPLYTYSSAALASLIGVGFLAPRLVSLASAVGCLGLTFLLVRRETGSAFCGLAGAGFLAGTYPLSIGRVDNLFLFFLLAAFLLVRSGDSIRHSALAGVMMGLAYLTKQTALLPLASLTLYVMFEQSGWRRFALPAVSGTIIAGTTLFFSLLTGGWYFFYTVRVPNGHGLGQEAMLAGFWRDDIGWTLAPAVAMGLVHLSRALRDAWGGRASGFVFYSTLTVGMLGASWISRLHGPSTTPVRPAAAGSRLASPSMPWRPCNCASWPTIRPATSPPRRTSGTATPSWPLFARCPGRSTRPCTATSRSWPGRWASPTTATS